MPGRRDPVFRRRLVSALILGPLAIVLLWLGGLVFTAWVAAFAAAEANAGVDLGAAITKVGLRFDNNLAAKSNDNSSVAFVKKKQVEGVQVETSEAVPEPSAGIVLLLGLGATLSLARRAIPDALLG